MAGAKATLVKFLQFNRADRLDSAECKSLFSGELSGGKQPKFAGDIKIDTVVAIDDSQMVARMPVTFSNSSTIDTYWYVDKQGSDWKITAMRASATTIISQQYLDILKKVAQPNSAQNEQMANLSLALSTDEQLKAWFFLHAPDMEQLKTLVSPYANGVVIRNPELGHKQTAYPLRPAEEQVEALLTKLHLSTVDKSAPLIKITIGGMDNNSNGFIYCLNDQPPKISRDRFIWVEHIFGQWYLFKAALYV